MKIVAFDLELAKPLPEEGARDLSGLGISCAAAWTGEPWRSAYWYNWRGGQNSIGQLLDMVETLRWYQDEGYRLVTWNGLQFDFAVLAAELAHEGPEMQAVCAELALNHTDLMFAITAAKGYYANLDGGLAGMGCEPKLHTVTLRDGTALEGMDGAQAPALWAAGEHDAVLAYLHRDVEGLRELANLVEQQGVLKWRSRRGIVRALPNMSPLPTVRDCLAWPLPQDTKWMTNPPMREDFIAWMPDDVRRSGQALLKAAAEEKEALDEQDADTEA